MVQFYYRYVRAVLEMRVIHDELFENYIELVLLLDIVPMVAIWSFVLANEKVVKGGIKVSLWFHINHIELLLQLFLVLEQRCPVVDKLIHHNLVALCDKHSSKDPIFRYLNSADVSVRPVYDWVASACFQCQNLGASRGTRTFLLEK